MCSVTSGKTRYYPHGSEITHSSEAELGTDGKLTLTAPVPASDEAVAAPRTLTMAAEVTDINQQTIAGSNSIELPSSEFYLGLKRPAYFSTVGSEIPLELVAIADDGQPYAPGTPVEIALRRTVWNTVKKETAGGGITYHSEKSVVPVLDQAVTIPATAKGSPNASSAPPPIQAGARRRA